MTKRELWEEKNLPDRLEDLHPDEYHLFQKIEHNCYSCSRFEDCQTEPEYMFEHCDEWRTKK